ncbi:hypothetical protein [Spirosoma flavum]|uniref:Uncharacterized protein n=1 Tax=Spirosoma flavum TaxID=2048557 RepID=A0ABW6ASY2_9BACT
MDSETKWLTQRITLLQTHLQELKELSCREQKAHQDLKVQHQQPWSQPLNTDNKAITLVKLVTQQVRQITALSTEFSTERKALLACHKQDEFEQNEWIKLERERKRNQNLIN